MPSDIADVGCPLGSIAGTARRGNVLSAVRGGRRQCGGLCRLKKGRRWKIKKPLGRSTGQSIGCPTSGLTQTQDTPTLDAHFNGVADMAAVLAR